MLLKTSPSAWRLQESQWETIVFSWYLARFLDLRLFIFFDSGWGDTAPNRPSAQSGDPSRSQLLLEEQVAVLARRAFVKLNVVHQTVLSWTIRLYSQLGMLWSLLEWNTTMHSIWDCPWKISRRFFWCRIWLHGQLCASRDSAHYTSVPWDTLVFSLLLSATQGAVFDLYSST